MKLTRDAVTIKPPLSEFRAMSMSDMVEFVTAANFYELPATLRGFQSEWSGVIRCIEHLIRAWNIGVKMCFRMDFHLLMDGFLDEKGYKFQGCSGVCPSRGVLKMACHLLADASGSERSAISMVLR